MHRCGWTRCRTWSRILDEAQRRSCCAQRAAVETNSGVKKEIATGLALAALDGPDAQARLAAIATLRSSLRQDVLNKLQALAREISGWQLRRKRRAGAAGRRGRGEVHRPVGAPSIPASKRCFFGLSLGSVLVLIAIGLAITFGVMGVINMAHGELMMLGAYTTYVVQVAMPNHGETSHPGGDSGGVFGCRPGRHPDRAHHHPLSLRKAAWRRCWRRSA